MTPISPPLRAAFVLADVAPNPLCARAREIPDVDVQITSVSQLKRQLPELETDVLVVDGRISEHADLIKAIRTSRRSLPVLFVAANLTDVGAASCAGANDFALAGASAAELNMRIRILSSAACRSLPRVRRVGRFRLERDTRRLSCGNRWVQLSPIELKMFERLLFQSGQPVSRADLERSIWRPAELADHPTNIAVVYISYLRRKLARLGDGCSITTFTSVGYALKFKPSSTPSTRSRSRV